MNFAIAGLHKQITALLRKRDPEITGKTTESYVMWYSHECRPGSGRIGGTLLDSAIIGIVANGLVLPGDCATLNP